jgi:hypothetical protein
MPLERPAQFADREFFTAAEAAAFVKARRGPRAQAPDNIHYDDALRQARTTIARQQPADVARDRPS